MNDKQVLLNEQTNALGRRAGANGCCCGKTNKKTALVTGSGSGIGSNIAIDLAKAGYFVIVTGRNECNLAQVVDECRLVNAASQSNMNDSDCTFQTATAFTADLADPRQLNNLIQFVKLNFKRLDLLVNNACWRGNYKNLLECDEAYYDFKQVMHLNVTVPLNLIKRCLMPMKAISCNACNDRVIVINISSIASQVVVPIHSYTISKACLSELTRQLAQTALSDLGIMSVTISPGPVITNERPQHQAMSNLTLQRRVGTTQEISDLVMFSISNAHMFNGKELIIDGGYIAKQKLSFANS